MTVQEAIKKHITECEERIFRIKDHLESSKDAHVDECKENILVLETAIQALEEVEQYRALGTVEELTNQKHNLSIAYKCIEELQQKDWIPFEQREADEEEKAHFLEHYGYELEYMLCGRLPDEDEEIIVSYSNGCVGEDIFLRDGVDCYLDSGNELVTEAIAWMPKPQPYKKEGTENE